MTWSKEHLPSRHTTEGVQNSFHRVFYYAMGLTTGEIHQPHVGVVTAWDDSAAIHDDLRAVAERVKDQLWAYELTPREFTTIPGFDRASSSSAPLLVSRELIADSTELTVRGHCYDALVGVGASSLALAGLAMAACRLDVPCVLVPVLELDSSPATADAAATVAALASLGLTAGAGTDAPNAASIRTVGDEAAAVLTERLRRRIRPRAGITADALDQAAVAVASTASTVEPLLHLAAIANECGVAVDVLTLATSAGAGLGAGAHQAKQLVPLRGSLAPDGAVACAAADRSTISGPARVAVSEDAACELLERGSLQPGEVIVLRGQGPRGGPGMPTCDRLLDLCEDRASLGERVAVVTDGRAPARAGVIVVSAVTPEAAVGGPLAGVRDGDQVSIDLEAGTVDVAHVRLGDRSPHAATTMTSPVLWKYAELVETAMSGARTHPGATVEQHCYADL